MANGDDATTSGGITIQLPPSTTGEVTTPDRSTLLLPQPVTTNALGGRPPPPTSGTYADAILQHEGYGVSGQNVPMGYGGFQPRTWMNFAKSNPDLFQGKTPDEILSMRSDRGLVTKGINWLANQNATYLKSHGIEGTGQNLGIAHFLGAGGASVALSSPDTMSMRDVLGKFLKPAEVESWIKSNPDLGKWTVADLKAKYASFPNLDGSLPTTTVATTESKPTDPDPKQVQQPATKNPLAMQTPEQPDYKSMMTWAMLQSLLPKGFAFHPIDTNPFEKAAASAQTRVPGVDWGMMREAPPKVGSEPARAAYSPESVGELLKQRSRYHE